MVNNNCSVNAPLDRALNTPLRILVQSDSVSYNSKRRYTKAQEIDALAVEKYKRSGRGITFKDLMTSGLAPHKSQSQDTLKRCHRKNILFVFEDLKPQRYYPSSLKSEIMKVRLTKNAPVGVTGLPYNNNTHVSAYDSVVNQTLVGHVLPMLPHVPLGIHKLELMVKISPAHYHDVGTAANGWNRGKEHEEVIGPALARYRFYPNGAVMVFVQRNNNPLKLENEDDLLYIIAFLGQLRDRLVLFLNDTHERIVPDITQWELKQCDVNRDVKVGEWLQYTGLKIQVRHACHLFRVYTKSKGKHTVCRVEESMSSKNKPVVEAISDIFNPTERLEKQIADLSRKFDQLILSCGNNISSITNKVAVYNRSNDTGKRWSIN